MPGKPWRNLHSYMRGHEITRAISDSTPITVQAILPVGCEHTSGPSASHPARMTLIQHHGQMFPPRQRGGPPPWPTPRFLDDPCVHAPLFDPGGPPVPGHYRTGGVVFRRINNVDSAFVAFEAQSRGLHALCVRFAARVAPGPRNTRFRLVASLDRSGLSPAGSHRRFPSCLSLYMASSLTRLCLAQ